MADILKIEILADDIAEKALDEFLYKGKTLREWVELMVTAETVVEVRMVEELEKIKEEIKKQYSFYTDYGVQCGCESSCEIIDKHIAKMKGDKKWDLQKF